MRDHIFPEVSALSRISESRRLHRLASPALALALVVGLGVGLAGILPAGSRAAPAEVCAPGRALDSEESAFLSLINGYRADSGLPPLVASVILGRSARGFALSLSEGAPFAHTDVLGRGASERARDCGYPGGAGENILAGGSRETAERAFEMWRNSVSHNENMLDPEYRQIGIARAYQAGSKFGWYWVTDFGLDDDGTDATALQ